MTSPSKNCGSVPLPNGPAETSTPEASTITGSKPLTVPSFPASAAPTIVVEVIPPPSETKATVAVPSS